MSNNYKQKYDTIISAGGTGGHIFPAEALYSSLKEEKKKIKFISDIRFKQYQTNIASEDIKIIKASRLNKSIFCIIKFLFITLSSTLAIFKLILSNNIKYTICFGGYPVVPTILATIILRKKLIIHEQNLCFGRVNRLFLCFAHKILISFPMSEEYLQQFSKKIRDKIHLTGLPIRQQIIDIKKKDKPKNDKIKITIIGGSQGSKILSEIIPQALGLFDKILLEKIEITHQAPQLMIDSTEKLYKELGFQNYIIKPFLQNIEEYLYESDLIISRAGAGSIAELIYLEKFMILVPIKNSVNNHQLRNAQFIHDHKLGIFIEEEQLSALILKEKIMHYINNDSNNPHNDTFYKKMLEKLHNPIKNITSLLN